MFGFGPGAHMILNMQVTGNASTQPGSGAADLPLEGVRVFVAEDEFLLALDLCDILARAGAEVLGPARSRAEAETYAAAGFAPDVALLDLNLGGDSSARIALELAGRGVPVILTTGYDAGDVPEELRDMPVCLKPISATGLLRTISGVLQRAS